MNKFKYIFSALIFLGSFLVLCHANAADCPEIGKGRIAKALGVTELIGIISIEVATCDELVLSNDSVGFRLRENTLPVHGGIRSEVAVNFPFQEGDIVSYSWEMKFPLDFSMNEPSRRWWALAQWHDQPDRRIGETWATFPSKPPPLAIYIEQREGVSGMGLMLNGGQDKISWAKLPLDQWLKVSVIMRWSSHEDGITRLDVTGYPELSLLTSGRNMNNSYQHYLKFGQYRNPKIKSDTTVYFKNLNISKLKAMPNLQ